MEPEKVVIDKVDARQGTTRPGMRTVLIGGLVLVIIAFALVWALG